MRNVIKSLLGIIAIVFLLESSVGAVILAALGYSILAAASILVMIVVRLYIALLQGRRWESAQTGR